MRIFLIDYENVNSAGLHGIGQAAPDDRVILFHSHAANTISFELFDELKSASVIPERVCISKTGKNALDFQLVTFLGYLIAKEHAGEYYIISRDSGFESTVTFCRDYLGTNVQLRHSIKAAIGSQSAKKAKKAATVVKPTVQSAPVRKNGKKATVSLKKRSAAIQVQSAPIPVPVATAKPESAAVSLDYVRSLIEPPVTAETASEILHCLQDSHSKTEFHNALQQHFDKDNVKLYYHCMKPAFVSFAAEE